MAKLSVVGDSRDWLAGNGHMLRLGPGTRQTIALFPGLSPLLYCRSGSEREAGRLAGPGRPRDRIPVSLGSAGNEAS